MTTDTGRDEVFMSFSRSFAPVFLAAGILTAAAPAIAQDGGAAPPAAAPATTAPASAAPIGNAPTTPPAERRAVCRSPQRASVKRGQMFAIDGAQPQADEWAAWMTEQLAHGRVNFIVLPIKPVERDQDEPQEVHPVGEVVCAW